MEDFRWSNEDDLAQQLEVLSAPLSVEEQDAIIREMNRLFEGYGGFIDSVLSYPGDVAPEERTTDPSSFQSNCPLETENNTQQEGGQNTANGRCQSPAPPSMANSGNGYYIGGDNGGDGRDLGSLLVLSSSKNYGREGLSFMKDDNEDGQEAGNVAIPKDNPNEGSASATSTFASDDESVVRARPRSDIMKGTHLGH